MRAGDAVLAVERGRDRDLQRLGERDQLGARAGCAHAAASNDNGSLCCLKKLQECV